MGGVRGGARAPFALGRLVIRVPFIGMANLIAGRIKGLAESAGRLAQGRLDVPLVPRGRDEIGDLVDLAPAEHIPDRVGGTLVADLTLLELRGRIERTRHGVRRRSM